MLRETPQWRWRWLLLFGLAAVAMRAPAQGTPGWLRYAIPPDPPRYHGLPHAVVLLGNNGEAAPEELAAADELDRGLGHMVAGTDVVLHRFDPRIDAVVLGTTEALHRARIGRWLPGWTEKPLPEEGFRIVHLRRGIREWYILQGGSPRAELWAAFRFAALVAEDQQLPEDFSDAPAFPLRAVDLRGDAGLLPLLEGTGSARSGLLRLLASVGINGLLVDANTVDAARVLLAARPYGMRVWLRATDAGAWHADELQQLAGTAPNLGGVVLPIPQRASLQQLRTLVSDANSEARLLRRTGGTVILQDALGPPFREPLASAYDRSDQLSSTERAAFLRDALEPNVVLGGAVLPVLQPLLTLASPHFGLLPAATQAAFLSVLDAPASALAFPAPAWAAALGTPERGPHGDTPLRTLLAGAGVARPQGGLVGVLPAEQVSALLQQPLLQANLYAFGRLAWAPAMPVETVADEWSRQTWGDDARAHGVSTEILLRSTRAARVNSAPLGLPLLQTATGAPDPQRAEVLRVEGQPLTDKVAIGTDRTAKGTDEIALYPESFAAAMRSPATCPEDWLLLLHRLPYAATLPGGETVAQAFYDAHFRGAGEAGNAVDAWETTRGLVDEPRYQAVHAFLVKAATRAEIQREAATEWMQQTSGVRDRLGFVGSHPGRTDANAMQLTGYQAGPSGNTAQSSSRGVVCPASDCSATLTFSGEANVYRVAVGYVDEHSGSAYTLLVNGEARAQWQSSTTELPGEVDRFVVNGVRLSTGDAVTLRVHTAGGGEAPLHFLEITRDPRWN